MILCGGDTGRLVRRFVHEEEIASDVFSWVGSFRLPALMEFHIDLREGEDVGEAIALLDEELEKLQAGGVTQEEIMTARNRVLLGSYNGFASVGGRASALGFYETVLGDCEAITRKLGELKKVTAEDVLEASRAYLVRPCRTIVTAVPVRR